MTAQKILYGTKTSREYQLKMIVSATENIDANESVITVTKLSCLRGNGTAYEFNSTSGSITINGVQKHFSIASYDFRNTSEVTLVQNLTWTVPHNDDGSKTVSISASWNGNNASIGLGMIYLSNTYTLDTIPRASDFTLPAIALGTEFTITIDKKASNFKSTLIYKCGNEVGTIIELTSNTSITTSMNIALSSNAPNSTKVDITFMLSTYNGSTLIGTIEKTIKASIPSSVKPTVAYTLTDDKGFLGKYSKFIKGQSIIHLVVNAQGVYRSTIKSVEILGFDEPIQGTEAIYPVLENDSRSTISAQIKVTDSRNRTAELVIAISLLTYHKSSITIQVGRCNVDGVDNDKGEKFKVKVTGTIPNLGNLNSKSWKLEYKKTSENTWQTLRTSSEYIFPASWIVATASDVNSNNSYNVRITATDDFGSTIEQTVVSTGFTLIDYDEKSIAFGKVAEKPNAFEVALDTYNYNPVFNKNNVRMDGICYKSTETGTSVQLNVPIVGETSRRSIFFWGNGNGQPHFGVVYYQGNGTCKHLWISADGGTLTTTYENGVITIDGFHYWDRIAFIATFDIS